MTQKSLQRLYEVFKGYKPELADSSPITPLPPELKKRLLTTPLAKLTEEDLRGYAFKALTTWGNDRDFRSFLPRLLEGTDENREVLFSKFCYAKWEAWPPEEQEALKSYFMEYWISALMQPVREGEEGAADRVLCCLAQAMDDLSPYLKIWEYYGEAAGESAYLNSALAQLRAFLKDNHEDLISKKRPKNAFWKERVIPSRQVFDWLRSPVTLSRFQSRWENRQYSSSIGADSGWLEDTIEVMRNFQNYVSAVP